MSNAELEAAASEIADADDLVASVIDIVDELIGAPDRETVIAGLNAEIDLVQARFSVLSAIRDSLLPDSDESNEGDELPLAELEPLPLADASRSDLESLIVQYVSKNGPSMPGAIAAAIGVHSTKIGLTVTKSNALAKDGKLIIVKLS